MKQATSPSWWYAEEIKDYRQLLEQSSVNITAKLPSNEAVIREKVKVESENSTAFIKLKGVYLILLPQTQISSQVETFYQYWLEVDGCYKQESPDVKAIYNTIAKKKEWYSDTPVKVYGYKQDHNKILSALVANIVQLENGGLIATGTNGRAYILKQREHQFVIDVDMGHIASKPAEAAG